MVRFLIPCRVGMPVCLPTCRQAFGTGRNTGLKTKTKIVLSPEPAKEQKDLVSFLRKAITHPNQHRVFRRYL